MAEYRLWADIGPRRSRSGKRFFFSASVTTVVPFPYPFSFAALRLGVRHIPHVVGYPILVRTFSATKYNVILNPGRRFPTFGGSLARG
jgi:hypothetical protein